ncbi:MAG TPA: DNA primase [Prolixibacteraceae bacterium]|nr:MAG: hypothetical protein A2W92_11510 [Bacteroidetes bacterium GWA2_42_15]OFX98224.1 MAG: hypothetical protein A2W89_09905 [Bacteroidetes bacterium GWE2_42_39]HAZ03022.1 DNA primase [Marinilabiliales bacterium]HBL74328.1 DNA primase [Prolixibacteraceae bacterium]
MKKIFNPNDWIQTTDNRDAACCVSNTPPLLDQNTNSAPAKGRCQALPDGGVQNYPATPDFLEVLSRLESSQTDITANYSDWRDIGFALTDEFGESGREYFHRISRFYHGYSQIDCDKQYDNCLKSTGHGITLKTFFHLVKKAGINLKTIVQNSSPVKGRCQAQPDGGVQIPQPFPDQSSNFSPFQEPVPNSIREEVSGFAGQRGLSSSTSNMPVKAEQKNLPLIPSHVYDSLPEILQDACSISQSDNERDILLLGSITTISSCIPKVYGIYGGQKVYSNLYLFVTALASAGKGMLTHCKRLVYPVHKKLREKCQLLKAEYDTEMNIYNANKKKTPNMEKPQKPPEKLLYIPANSSATGVFQLLSDNDGKGLIFETEGDTLAITFKSDYGNYSDGFRKAFHHETISYYRRTDREHVEIDKPQLSAVLSGTPKQVTNLIPDAENGLFSRFIFYYLDMKSEWKDVFARPVSNGIENYFNELGYRFYELYKELNSNLDTEFNLTEQQQSSFNSKFSSWQDFYEKLLGNEYNATVRRLGLITFRIAMIFTVLRILETGEIQSQLICTERDFNNAVSITEILIQHAQKVYSDLPTPVNIPKRENREQRFFNQLPEIFSRQDYLRVAGQLEIPDKTAQGYIAKFDKKGLIHRDKKDFYLKVHVEETKD